MITGSAGSSIVAKASGVGSDGVDADEAGVDPERVVERPAHVLAHRVVADAA